MKVAITIVKGVIFGIIAIDRMQNFANVVEPVLLEALVLGEHGYKALFGLGIH